MKDFPFTVWLEPLTIKVRVPRKISFVQRKKQTPTQKLHLFREPNKHYKEKQQSKRHAMS